MTRLICAVLGSYVLLLCLSNSLMVGCQAMKDPWSVTQNRAALPHMRKAREVTKPVPIDCKMKKWSSWSPCNSCTDKKFRFQSMEKASQFGGSLCVGSQWEELACPRATSECLVPDLCDEKFTCNETGRCISKELRCNGENDCAYDQSDERVCVDINKRTDKCASLMPIPGAGRSTQGFNVLTGEFVAHVLDPKYYGGICEYVYNGEWRKLSYDTFCEKLHYNDEEKYYRKPYNFHSYRFTAEATSEGSDEYYEDMATLLKARETNNSFNVGFTVGVQYVEAGVSGGLEWAFSSNITKHKSQDLGFVRLLSKVQTAQFKMRSEQLMMEEGMYMSLMELPEEYDFGRYSRFLNTFGTHYVTQGVMGGTLEYVMVVNKTTMRNSKFTGHQIGACIGGSFGLGSPLGKNVKAELKVRGEECLKTGGGFEDLKKKSDLIEDIIVRVKGGNTESSGGLVVIKDPDMYRKWGVSLKYNPTLIDYEIMPIYELVRVSTAAFEVGSRLAHLRTAWEEYLMQFNSCRCSPCMHNGIPVLKQTTCSCICPGGFTGDACQETARKDAKTDGVWSCWGTWASCQSGNKIRTRSCNNPAPANGGAACRGSSSQKQRC